MFQIRKTIAETEKKIKRLGERSQDISGVIEIIGDVAERTRVLAINASMQAASAGEAGKGFAVVAEEVQRLAESSRRSTSEIVALVRNIQLETAETMEAMNTAIGYVVAGTNQAKESNDKMRDTQQTTQRLVEAVKQIAQTSRDQALTSSKLCDDSERIIQISLLTANELKKQTQVTNDLVDYSQRMVLSVEVFRLPQNV